MKIVSALRRHPHCTPLELQRLPELPTLSALDRILLIVPHPDDEVLGSGGLLQRAIAVGAQVRILLVTSGNKWGKEVIRRREIKKAVGICGVEASSITFCELNDGRLHREDAHIEQFVSDTLQDFRPTRVITSDPADLHRDHAVLARVVAATCKKICPDVPVYGVLIHFHRFPGKRQGYTLRPPLRLLKNSRWYTFWLTEAEQHIKLVAIEQYKSQLVVPLLRGLMYSFNRRNEIYRLL